MLKLYLLILFSLTYAERVNKIEIFGNERISDETIKMFTKVTIGDNLNKNEVNNILKIFMKQIFQNVSLVLINNTLTIKVDENPIIENILQRN